MKRSFGESPDGFVFIPAGNVTRTRLVKQVPEAIEYAEWTRWGAKVTGYYIPAAAAEEINRQLAASEERRAKQREKSAARRAKAEASYQDEFRATLQRLFPSMPAKDADAIVRRATRVGSGTVGRSRMLDLEDKATLATVAHARHQHTKYESILKDERAKRAHYGDRAEAKDEAREEARLRTMDDVADILATWREERQR